MKWFFTSTDLRTRLIWLRRALPVSIVGVVLVYQIISLYFLRTVSESLRFLIDILFYGTLGPFASWFVFNWVLHRVEERERALADKEEAEREQQRAMEIAREQERLLAAVCSNSADAIVTLDNDGIIKTWNRGAEMMFGYTAPEVVSKHYRMIVPPELQARGEIDWLSEQMKQQGYIRNFQTERIAQDGRRVIADLTRTQILNEQGEVIGSSAILRDITARVQSELAIQQLNLELETKVIERTTQLGAATEELRHRNEELEQKNEELRKLDELKSEFVSMVSHELRAPLTNINGSIELLLEGNSACYDPDHRELLQIAADQSARLTRLVQGILNVNRIEAGQLVLQPQPFNILGLIDKVIDVWETRGVSNRFFRPDVVNLPSVWADRDRAEEVLFNLIDNAIKYSTEAAPITIHAHADSRIVQISVSDRGIGIPHEEIIRIFEKFHRVDRKDAMESYGHGLGLYICRQLVQAMGGQIWVESLIGEGSTFRFSLPLAGRSEVEPGSDARHQTTGGRG